jgi:hypothetical protein
VVFFKCSEGVACKFLRITKVVVFVGMSVGK